ARVEERIGAGGAEVRALAVMIPVLAGERPLRTLLAQNAVLLGRQGGLPLLLGLLDAAGGVLDHGGNLPPSDEVRRRYSDRSADTGSTRLALPAGENVAASATPARSAGTAARGSGAGGPIPNSSDDIAPGRTGAPARPAATRAAARRPPSASSIAMTSAGRAPSAIRIPISRVRCETP